MSPHVPRLKDMADAFKRDKVREMLSRCTEKQQAIFDKLYPMGLAKIPEDRLNNVFDQCARTVAQNEGKAEGGAS